MAKTLSLQTELYIETGVLGSGTFVKVGNLNSISMPGPEKGETEVTDYDSTAREFLGTLPDNGEMTFGGFWNGVDAGQVAMYTDANDSTSPTRNFRIDQIRQDARFSFQGYVRRFRYVPGGIDDPLTYEGAIRVTGAVTKIAIP